MLFDHLYTSGTLLVLFSPGIRSTELEASCCNHLGGRDPFGLGGTPLRPDKAEGPVVQSVDPVRRVYDTKFEVVNTTEDEW